MKWAYLFLSVFAAYFAADFIINGPPGNRPNAVRICITGSLVNLVIFLAMHFAQKHADKKKTSNARPEQSKE